MYYYFMGLLIGLLLGVILTGCATQVEPEWPSDPPWEAMVDELPTVIDPRIK